MMVKLVVDGSMCIGCGLCVGTYSDVFEFDDEGKATVVNEIDESLAEDAVANCPVGAISE